MELKRCVNEADELRNLYGRLLKSHVTPDSSKSDEKPTKIELKNYLMKSPHWNDDNEEEEEKAASVSDTIIDLQSFQKRIIDLEPKVEKFSVRLSQKDPVTNAPRYGEQTTKKVTSLIDLYGELKRASELISNGNSDSNTGNILLILQKYQENEKSILNQIINEQKHQELLEKQQALQNLEIEKQNQEEKERIERLNQETKNKELHLHANAKRTEKQTQERLRIDQFRQRQINDREYMKSIQKGKVGTQAQIKKLSDSLQKANQVAEYKVAITSLHLLFSQILKHPEEENNRCIRVKNNRFHQDIGRHDGAQDILIAAGFQIRRTMADEGEQQHSGDANVVVNDTTDDEITLLMIEPNIETQMDDWSMWFDSLKDTHEVLEHEMLKLKSIK